MKKILLITTGMLALMLLSGCIGGGIGMKVVTGEGPVINETRDVSGFDMIEINMGAELIIEQGETESLEIEARENLLPYLTSEVSGGKLILSVDRGISLVSGRAIIYRLTVKDLSELKINGAVMLSANDLDLDELTVIVNGTGTCTLTGDIREQIINISGGATYNAEDVTSENVTVLVNGVSTVSVNASEILDVIINGTGTVTYSGNPDITQEINGVGSVRKR